MATVNRNTLLSKLLSITLSFVVIVSGFSLFGTQLANAATVDREGTFDNIKWTLDTDGKLTLKPNEGTSATLSVELWGLLQIPIGNAPWLERVTNSDLPSKNAQYILDNTEEILIEEGIVLTGDCRQMFRGFTNMTSIVGIKLSNVTDISRMFASCEKLENINVSEWDMSTVTNTTSLFYGCKTLKTLDVSKWNTSKLSSMGDMFYECNSLEYLDVSNWSLDKAANINRMFYNCKSLNNLDTSKWTAPLLTNMEWLFWNCASLDKVDVSGLNIKNVKSLSNVFYNLGKNAGQAQIIGLDKLNTANVTNFSGVFNGCNVSEVDVSEWNTAKATNMANMFRGTKLSTLDLSSFDTGNVTSMSGMFAESDIADIKVDLDKWTTENVTSLGSMFYKSSITDDQFNALNIANWDTKNSTSFGSLFSECHNLTKLDLSKWDTSKAPVDTSQVPIRNITYGCRNLEELDLSGWTCASDMGQLTCPAIKKVVLGPGYQPNMFRHFVNFNLYNIKDSDNPVKLEPKEWFADWGTYVRGRKITYKANYGTAADQESYIFYSVDGNLKENTFSRQNYYFTGWNTAANGTGQAFSNKEAVDYDDERFTSDELTLYAQWKYDADENNDGIKDRFQIFVHYESYDSSMGNVTGQEYEIKNAKNYTKFDEEADFTGIKTSGSQVTPEKGYMLRYWRFLPAGGTEQRSPDGVFALDDIKGGSDITITAMWAEDRNGNNTPDDEETRHSVTYKYAEGSPSDVPELPSALTDQLPGIEITVADNPNNIEGYVFGGWKVTTPASGTSISGGKFNMPEEDVFITGTWKDDKDNNGVPDEDESWTVAFDPNGKTFKTNAPAAQTVAYGEKAIEPTPPPTAEKAKFDGWYKEPACTTEFNFNLPITFNETVYAKWLPDENENDIDDTTEPRYTVVYKDGESSSVFADKSFPNLLVGVATPAYGDADPVWHQHLFKAWTPTLKDKVAAADADATTKEIVYTATWAEDKNNDKIDDATQYRTITYIDGEANGASFTNIVYGPTEKLLDGDNTPVPTFTTASEKPEWADHVFVGWNPQVAGTISGNATYTATWKDDKNNDGKPDDEQPYTVNFDANGKTFATNKPADQSVIHGEKAQKPVNDPTAEKAIFSGWYKEPACSTTFDFEAGITANTTIYAKWQDDENGDGINDATQDHFTVTYTDGVDGEEVFPDEVHVDVLVNLPTPEFTGGEPTRTGFGFKGWQPAVADTVTANVAYTATWFEDRNGDGVDDATQYRTITYKDGEANGASFANIVYGPEKKLLDGDHTPTPEFPGGKPKWEKHVFAGWDPQVAGTIGRDATYLATWKDDRNGDGIPDDEQTYIVNFDPGTKKFKTNAPADQSVLHGETAVKPEKDPTAEKAIFDGWYKDMECREAFDFEDPIVRKTSIYAKWLPDKNENGIPDDKEKIVATDEEGNPVTPDPDDPIVEPGSDPKPGDKFQDENGDWYEITEVGKTDSDTGETPITVKPVPKTYDDVKDEDKNPVKPETPFNDDNNKPEEGKKFLDDKGNPYEITKIGETDPKTGDTPITVKPVPKSYDDVKDEEGNPVKPKEPLGKDGKEPKVGDRFEDDKGNEYEITELGASDKDGNVPVKVGQVMTLTFDLDGGMLEGQTGTYVVKELKNRNFVIPMSAPTKEGYVFDYWQGSKYYPGQIYVVKDNHKFTAIWKTADVGATGSEDNDAADTDDDDDSDSGSKKKSVKTGDESNAALWIALMLISCMGAIGSIAYRRRRD